MIDRMSDVRFVSRLVLAMTMAGPVAAQPASAPPASSMPAPPAAPAAALPYASVAAARKAIEAGDGNGFIVTHADGWTIANEPAAAAQWSFTPNGYYAYPAVVRRVIRRSPGGEVSVETAALCEATPADCQRLQDEFHQLDDRIRQSVKSRQRPQPTPPPAALLPPTPPLPAPPPPPQPPLPAGASGR